MRARLLLAGIAFLAIGLSAQPQGVAPTSGATPAVRAGSARLHPARPAVFLGVPDTEVGAAEEVGVLAGGFSPYPMPGGVARAMRAEPGEPLYRARPATERPVSRPQPAVSSGGACPWLWVSPSMPICW